MCTMLTARMILVTVMGSNARSLLAADEEAAAEDGSPRVGVMVADCGQL